jgi:hypothetical protein
MCHDRVSTCYSVDLVEWSYDESVDSAPLLVSTPPAGAPPVMEEFTDEAGEASNWGFDGDDEG